MLLDSATIARAVSDKTMLNVSGCVAICPSTQKPCQADCSLLRAYCAEYKQCSLGLNDPSIKALILGTQFAWNTKPDPYRAAINNRFVLAYS